jgi:hypothetical protein
LAAFQVFPFRGLPIITRTFMAPSLEEQSEVWKICFWWRDPEKTT